MKYDVFISYRRESGTYQAQALRANLEHKFCSVFMDTQKMGSGDFTKKLDKKIREFSNFVVIISKGCFPHQKKSKDYFIYEIGLALKLGKNVIPVYYDDMRYEDIEEYLSWIEDFHKQNAITYHNDDPEGSVNQIISFLKTKEEMLNERFRYFSKERTLVRQDLMLLRKDTADLICPVCDTIHSAAMTYCHKCGYKFFDNLEKSVANSNEELQERERIEKHKELWYNCQYNHKQDNLQLTKELEEMKARLRVSETKQVELQKQLETLKRQRHILFVGEESFVLRLSDKISFKMILVRGGEFKMGADDKEEDAYNDEKPQHWVTLYDYYIGETVVTQSLWNSVMGTKPNYCWSLEESSSREENHPAYHVSWKDCQVFIKRLKSMTGMEFRLPTEAEWEYAASGGKKSHGYKYAGGNTLNDVAWYEGNSGGKIHSVKDKKQTNELGLYDMSGNVWEWCQDWWGAYDEDSQTNPKGASSGSHRVLRGGGWYSDHRNCRVSNRNGKHPSSRENNIGFRLALSSKQTKICRAKKRETN